MRHRWRALQSLDPPYETAAVLALGRKERMFACGQVAQPGLISLCSLVRVQGAQLYWPGTQTGKAIRLRAW